MSCFIVSDKMISVMLQAAQRRLFEGDYATYRWNGESHAMLGSIQAIGQKLLNANYKSFNYRYNEAIEPDTFINKMLEDHAPDVIIGACSCYIYQACEAPDWQESEAYAIAQALRERAIKMLPGYHAGWQIE